MLLFVPLVFQLVLLAMIPGTHYQMEGPRQPAFLQLAQLLCLPGKRLQPEIRNVKLLTNCCFLETYTSLELFL